jgi:transcriptional regulator with XRE-family HTH domain
MSTQTIEPVYRSIGAKIEQLRTTLGWTQDDLAKKVGLARGSVANIETGRQRILLHDVERFSTAFNVSPKMLLRGIWF